MGGWQKKKKMFKLEEFSTNLTLRKPDKCKKVDLVADSFDVQVTNNARK